MALCKSSNIDKISQLFISARPTAINLKWAVTRMLSAIKSGKDPLTEAISIHEEDKLFCDLIGKHGSRLVPPRANIITICNTGMLD
jgi:methylthioribose-1-phosphate isomerase